MPDRDPIDVAADAIERAALGPPAPENTVIALMQESQRKRIRAALTTLVAAVAPPAYPEDGSVASDATAACMEAVRACDETTDEHGMCPCSRLIHNWLWLSEQRTKQYRAALEGAVGKTEAEERVLTAGLAALDVTDAEQRARVGLGDYAGYRHAQQLRAEHRAALFALRAEREGQR